jgi:hypothetical protein
MKHHLVYADIRERGALKIVYLNSLHFHAGTLDREP